MLVLESLVGLHRTIQLQLLCVWGINLYYCDVEWLALEMNRVHFVIFERLDPSTAFWTLLLTMMATPFLLRDSCP